MLEYFYRQRGSKKDKNRIPPTPEIEPERNTQNFVCQCSNDCGNYIRIWTDDKGEYFSIFMGSRHAAGVMAEVTIHKTRIEEIIKFLMLANNMK